MYLPTACKNCFANDNCEEPDINWDNAPTFDPCNVYTPPILSAESDNESTESDDSQMTKVTEDSKNNDSSEVDSADHDSETSVNLMMDDALAGNK